MKLKAASPGRMIPLILFLLLGSNVIKGQTAETVKIWDKGEHNAFTGLIRYKSYFYCTFREAKHHVPKDTSGNGTIRIIRSADGIIWEPVALLRSSVYDLRDPKLSVMPGKRLMVTMGGSHYINGTLEGMMPHVSFSDDGLQFSAPEPAKIQDDVKTDFDWIWRVTWKGKTGYGVVYQSQKPENIVRLLATSDGISYRQVKQFEISSLPNEATVRFDSDKNMLILLRREAKANGMLGKSAPPYTEWKWTELLYRLGGPDLLVMRNGNLIVGTRVYGGGPSTTAIYLTSPEGKIIKQLDLPSGGDTSYPGLLIHKNKLMVSYYSGHEGRTSVYLSSIPLKDFVVR